MRPAAVQSDVESFTAAMASANGSAALRQTIVDGVRRRSGCESSVFFDALDPGGRYVPTLLAGSLPAGSTPHFRASGALARWLRVNDELLVFSDRPDVWAHLSAEEQAQLKALKADACLPLVNEAELVAWVSLGSGQVREWSRLQTLLEACAKQAASVWRRVMQAERSQAQTEALRRSQLLGITGQIAASLAHEVRNPLAAIRSLVQFTRDVPLPATDRESMLGDVLDEVDRINQTMTGLLQLSQPASPVLRDLDVSGLVRSATRFVQAYAARYEVTLDVDTPLTGNIRVLGDERELRQVMTNLLLNACQACEKGSRVTVSVRLLDPAVGDSRRVAVEVADSGRGVAPENMDRVFEPFFTTKPQGAGLGLPFCREVVERHRGTIVIESRLGRGTSVRIRLPSLDINAIDTGR